MSSSGRKWLSMTTSPDVPGTVLPRQAAEAEPALTDHDRSQMTARLLDEIRHAPDESTAHLLREEVVVLNMGVAKAIAHRYARRGLNTDDLVQVAYVGLVKAVNGFDPSRERDFLSYAVPTVSGEVKRFFRDYGWTVRPPRRIQELQGRISHVSAEISQRLGRSPRPREVAEALGVDVEEVIDALAADGAFTPSSLDLPVGQEGGATVGEMVTHDDDGFGDAEARIMLAPAVRRLGERDRRIVELRFFEGWTQEQIARDIGVTQMQVSRLLARILHDLRDSIAPEQN
jgi:RNA polymerase sigma-B factor